MKKSTKALIGILVCVIVLAGAVVLLKVTEGVRGGRTPPHRPLLRPPI